MTADPSRHGTPPEPAGGAIAPVLVVEHLHVDFHTDEGVYPAVNDSSFSIQPGKVLALVGESGSGKTVTSLAVLGLLPHTARITGSIRLAGESLLDAGEHRMNQIRGAGISMIFQEPMTALNPTMTVGAQVAEVLTNHQACSRAEAARRAVDLLDRVGIPEPAIRAKGFPHELSGGQRQRVVIAIALACSPTLIIADEPTTALDVTVQAEILDLLRTLAHESQTAFLLITHNMGVVADIADDVAVMYRGDIVETGPMHQVLTEPRAEYSRQLIDAIPKMPAAAWDEIEAEALSGAFGTPDAPAVDRGDVERRDGSDVPPPPGDVERTSVRLVSSPSAPREAHADTSDVALSLDHVSIDYARRGSAVRAVNDASLTIVRGEILGLVGESGSGKSTIGRAALGLIPAAEGTVRVLDKPVHVRSLLSAQDKAVRAQVGVIFQDPGSSLDPRMTIAQSIEEPMLVHRAEGLRSGKQRSARVAELIDAVELPSYYALRFPHELSGGQRQRVGLARAIALNPLLLIADEPTSALDVSVQARVLDALRSLQDRYRFACLFISHDLAVINEMSHRVAVMWQGRIVEVGDTSSILVRPHHPYTIRLLAAVPSPDPREQARRRQARRVMADALAAHVGT